MWGATGPGDPNPASDDPDGPRRMALARWRTHPGNADVDVPLAEFHRRWRELFDIKISGSRELTAEEQDFLAIEFYVTEFPDYDSYFDEIEEIRRTKSRELTRWEKSTYLYSIKGWPYFSAISSEVHRAISNLYRGDPDSWFRHERVRDLLYLKCMGYRSMTAEEDAAIDEEAVELLKIGFDIKRHYEEGAEFYCKSEERLFAQIDEIERKYWGE